MKSWRYQLSAYLVLPAAEHNDRRIANNRCQNAVEVTGGIKGFAIAAQYILRLM